MGPLVVRKLSRNIKQTFDWKQKQTDQFQCSIQADHEQNYSDDDDDDDDIVWIQYPLSTRITVLIKLQIPERRDYWFLIQLPSFFFCYIYIHIPYQYSRRTANSPEPIKKYKTPTRQLKNIQLCLFNNNII